jgi:hypothetical protein
LGKPRTKERQSHLSKSRNRREQLDRKGIRSINIDLPKDSLDRIKLYD